MPLIQPVGPDFDLDTINARAQFNVRFTTPRGEKNVTPIHASHVLYQHDGRFYFIGNRATYDELTRTRSFSRDDLYRVEDVPELHALYTEAQGKTILVMVETETRETVFGTSSRSIYNDITFSWDIDVVFTRISGEVST